MLNQLIIQNLVIVHHLELHFGLGMSVLTGETGAGKSVLIDALGLTLGDKVDNSMIRLGCDKAEVSSNFDLIDCPQALLWLEEHDLAEDGQCLLRRVLVRDGHSRAYVNGHQVPQSSLKELGDYLLDIHGQHAHQSLLRNSAQHNLLDAYANTHKLANQVSQSYQTLKKAQNKLQAMQQTASGRIDRLDYLRFQLEELKPVIEWVPNIADIESQHKKLAAAERLQQEASNMLQVLHADEQDVSSMVGNLLSQSAKLLQLDSTIQPLYDLLQSIQIQIDEATQTLRHYLDSIEMDPGQYQLLDGQLASLHDIARKHRTEITELPTLAAKLQAEIDGLDNTEEALDELRHQVDAQLAVYRQHAQTLSEKRQQAAQKLSAIVTKSMQALNMQGGKFAIICQTDTNHIGKQGFDQVQFMVATNPGQNLAPLNNVASGGELSRISLAIQVATSNCGQVPSLIFDEVDVGIGGAVAETVGQLLNKLSQKRQILCITHLPQVAAQADQHYQVEKTVYKHTSKTHIKLLSNNERIDELARMLGGIEITQQTYDHAQAMLKMNDKP
jgi:DNA repair protein RecN (Recombination protein N)